MQINKFITPLSFALLIFAIRLPVEIFINSFITELLVIAMVPFVLGYISGTKFSVVLSKYFIIKTALIDALLQIVAIVLIVETVLIAQNGSPCVMIDTQKIGLIFVLDLIFLYLGNYLSLPEK